MHQIDKKKKQQNVFVHAIDGYQNHVLHWFIFRSPSKKFARRTVSGHTRDQIIQERNFIDGHRNLPKSQTFGGTPSTARPKSSNCVNNHSFNRYESINNQKRATLPHDYKLGSTTRGSIHSNKSEE